MILPRKHVLFEAFQLEKGTNEDTPGLCFNKLGKWQHLLKSELFKIHPCLINWIFSLKKGNTISIFIKCGFIQYLGLATGA